MDPQHVIESYSIDFIPVTQNLIHVWTHLGVMARDNNIIMA